MNRSILLCAALVASGSVSAVRVTVPISRTVAVVTKDNPTPYFRWPISVQYLPSGDEWAPESCSSAITELRAMVPREFLKIVASVIRANHDHQSAMWTVENTDSLRDIVVEKVGKAFPGEEGFLDELEAKIERAWASAPRTSVEFTKSCNTILGKENPAMWYALIFEAALADESQPSKK